jgi:branched-chain amino acid transport system substrate-binding protein
MGTILKKSFVSMACIMLLGGLVTACGSASGNSSGNGNGSTSGKMLTFGAMLPETGPSATLGESMVNGANLAVEQINNAGGVDGVKLKMVLEDNPGTPQTEVEDLQKLNSVYKVPFSLTSFSGATIAAAPIADKHQVVMINGGATTSDLMGHQYVFSDLALANIQVSAMLNYAYNTLGVRKLALIYGSDDQGQGFLKEVQKIWPSLGGQLVGTVQVSTSATDYSSQVTKLKSLSADAVYMGFFGTGQGIVLKNAAQQGFKTKWLGSSSMDNAGALKIAGAAAVGAYDIQQPLDPSNATALKFKSAYEAKYNVSPDQFASTYYTAVYVLADVIKSLHKANEPITGANIRKQMLSESFDTVFGTMLFNPDGTTSEAVSIDQYNGTKFTPIKTFSITDLKAMK